MSYLGVITIGQAPRTDITPILKKILPSKVSCIQVGVLDGMNKEIIAATLSPEEGDYILTSRLLTGESVVLSREKITPIVQEKINYLEAIGCNLILLLCTGEFEGLLTRTSYLIEPDQIIPLAVVSLVKNRKFGVILPLQDQEPYLMQKWSKYGLYPTFSIANPYTYDKAEFTSAAMTMVEHHVEVIMLDCMGYTEEMKGLIQEKTGLPVIVSNTIMIKLISEIL